MNFIKPEDLLPPQQIVFIRPGLEVRKDVPPVWAIMLNTLALCFGSGVIGFMLSCVLLYGDWWASGLVMAANLVLLVWNLRLLWRNLQ